MNVTAVGTNFGGDFNSSSFYLFSMGFTATMAVDLTGASLGNLGELAFNLQCIDTYGVMTVNLLNATITSIG